MSLPTGHLTRMPDFADEAAMLQLIDQQRAIEVNRPDSKPFVVATYQGGSTTVHEVAGTRSKIFTELGVEGRDDDPNYALLSVDGQYVCSNDAILLERAQAYLLTKQEVLREMQVAVAVRR